MHKMFKVKHNAPNLRRKSRPRVVMFNIVPHLTRRDENKAFFVILPDNFICMSPVVTQQRLVHVRLMYQIEPYKRVPFAKLP